MRYYVSLDPATNDAPEIVDLRELPNGALEVTVGGRRVDVDVVETGSALSIRIDGRVVDLTTEGSPPDLGAIANGHRSYVRVLSERQRTAESVKGGLRGLGDRVLKSPMPGRVVRVLVKPGDLVAQGQPLFVLEAMKMENEVKARDAATVLEVHVLEGATVETNAKLVTLQ